MKRLVTTILTAILLFGTAFASGNRIVVSKRNCYLYVIDGNNKLVFSTPVCLGMNKGNKTRRGDHKTPEGKFSIMSIENSTRWKDYDGVYRASYGPWFMRLKMPKFRSIGIHGTCEPESIGTRASQGCIRMLNENVVKLKKLVNVGTQVTILSENEDFKVPEPAK